MPKKKLKKGDAEALSCKGILSVRRWETEMYL